MQAADWLQIMGYLLLLVAVGYGVYQFLPRATPRVESAPSPRPQGPARRSPAEWGRLADEAEGYAPGHAERVAALAIALADAIGLADSERNPLYQAALLHDVGEIDFEPALLARPGPLNQAELFRLWDHPARGAQVAIEVTGHQSVAQWVRWNHERWDGLGYPDGLVGTAIPLPARIIRLADSADAMLHVRPYRDAMSLEATMAEINRLAGVSYDPDLARVFVDYVLPQFVEEGGLEARHENPWAESAGSLDPDVLGEEDPQASERS
jgi:HD-GYP domain-containing protein (c-di-GMP phosphodiesterase class II)